MKMNDLEVRYTDYGIGNRYSGYIELNRKLKDPRWRKLHDEILEHELSHTNDGYSVKDLMLDIRPTWSRGLYWKFFLTTPKAWLQLSPVYKSGKRIYFDISVTIAWIILGITIWIMMLVI